MSELIDRVLARNAEWAQQHHQADLDAAPARQVAVVTCMDCRIDTLSAYGLELGDAHVIRNAGALATDDVERSLLLSQYTLGTRTVLVIAHTRCGLVGVDQDAVAAQVEAERGARPDFAVGSIVSPEDEARRAVRRFRESPVLKHTDDVHGFVFDVDSGRIQPVEA